MTHLVVILVFGCLSSANAFYVPQMFSSLFVSPTSGVVGEVDSSTGTTSRWEFSEGSGATTEDSLDASRTGSVIDATWISTGINNTNAINVSASTGYVWIEDDAVFSSHAGDYTTGVMSISFWVYPRDMSVDRYFIGKGDTDNYEFSMGYYPATDRINAVLLTSAGGGFSNFYSSAAVLNAHQWNHLVWVVDKSQPQNSKSWLYINNNRSNTTPTDAAAGTTTDGNRNVRIGRYFTDATGGWCDCIIDKLKFYDRVLSKEDVNILFQEKTE